MLYMKQKQTRNRIFCCKKKVSDRSDQRLFFQYGVKYDYSILPPLALSCHSLSLSQSPVAAISACIGHDDGSCI